MQASEFGGNQARSRVPSLSRAGCTLHGSRSDAYKPSCNCTYHADCNMCTACDAGALPPCSILCQCAACYRAASNAIEKTCMYGICGLCIATNKLNACTPDGRSTQSRMQPTMHAWQRRRAIADMLADARHCSLGPYPQCSLVKLWRAARADMWHIICGATGICEL